MPSLKDLKDRISSVKSTRKITSAMKMVAASKLRRAQEQAESSRPYTGYMSRMMSNLAAAGQTVDVPLPLLNGNGKEDTILLIAMTSDRGLCGAFNSSVIRETRRQIDKYEHHGKTVKLICIGRKAYSALNREHGDKIVHNVESAGKKQISFDDARELATKLSDLFDEGAFDVAYIIFNRFISAISQVVKVDQLVPFSAVEVEKDPSELTCELFEPEADELVAQLLKKNLAVQLFAALLESSAGEQGARMTAMDNATRNAGDMIDRLTLNYNRSRQAYITSELIEIISGAEAV